METLDDLLLGELGVRSRLNALVHERAEALREADRLHVRATRPGGDPGLEPQADRWRIVAERVAGEIEDKRRELREAEARVATARADAAGA
jgi:hypothetical protein